MLLVSGDESGMLRKLTQCKSLNIQLFMITHSHILTNELNIVLITRFFYMDIFFAIPLQHNTRSYTFVNESNRKTVLY